MGQYFPYTWIGKQTYRDVTFERFVVKSVEFLLDLNHVDFTARHDDADQVTVRRARL